MASTTCAYCGRLTHMTAFGGINAIWRGGYGRPSNALVEAPFTCDNCRRLSIGIGMSDHDPSNAPGNDIDGRWGWSENPGGLNWLPLAGVARDYPDVPEHIAPAASEAHACQSIGAHRAAVMVARAVIEATAKNKGVINGMLFNKIEKMHELGLISELVRDQAHEVRYLGNDMAHGDFVDPVSAEEADEVLELMAEVLHAVFVVPAQLKRRKEARLAKKPDKQV
jgi:hypothetical protein